MYLVSVVMEQQFQKQWATYEIGEKKEWASCLLLLLVESWCQPISTILSEAYYILISHHLYIIFLYRALSFFTF